MTQKIVEYITVQGEIEPHHNQSRNGLDDRVKQRIKEGYQPYGNPYYFGQSHPSAAQAMVKYEEHQASK